MRCIQSHQRKPILKAVDQLLFYSDIEKARAIVKEMLTEFTASSVWAEEITYDHKVEVMDLMNDLDELLQKISNQA